MTQHFQPHPTSRRLSLHLFELAVAASWVIVGLAYLVDPATTLALSPVGHDLHPALRVTWSVLEVAGGTGVLYGIVAARANHRVAGLVLLAAGLTVHGVAAMAGGLELRDGIYFIYAAACALRAVIVTRFALEDQ